MQFEKPQISLFGYFWDTVDWRDYKNLRLLPWSPNFAMLRSRLLTRHREHFHRQIERLHERQTRELDMTMPCKSTCIVKTKGKKPTVLFEK